MKFMPKKYRQKKYILALSFLTLALIVSLLFFDNMLVSAVFGPKKTTVEPTVSSTHSTEKKTKPSQTKKTTTSQTSSSEKITQQTTTETKGIVEVESETPEPEIVAEAAPVATEKASVETPSAPPVQTAPAETYSAPEPEAIGANMIGINGTYKPYIQLGDVGTAEIQSQVDNGSIVAALTYFNPNDGQTTYIAGHNPGVMAYFEGNMAHGASVTITDGNGTAFNYQAVDRVTVNTDGTAIFSSLNMSAIDAYAYGTGQESLLIQYCNSYDGLITMWYLLPQ